MPRVWNFAAGPSTLPQAVLQQAADELLDWQGKGVSVMEMSHRSPEYMSIFGSAQENARRLLNVPSSHTVLFMQGGAVGMNAIIPMNLMQGFERAGFVNTGVWSQKTLKEFAKYGQAVLLADNSTPGVNGASAAHPWSEGAYIPNMQGALATLQEAQASTKPLAYVHYCDNETIAGLEFNGQMEALMQNLQGHAGYNPDCPLVADVSSNILSRPVDVARYGILYGGAQKNVGSAGVTLVVVHNSLLPRALPFCPSAFEFKTVAANGSMYNTPPTYAIYIAGLVFEWLLKQGGVAWAEQHAQRKSQLLYQCIDQSNLYYCQVKPQDRSRMNVSFRLRNTELEPLFLEKAKQRGLVHLKGHKLVGGMRASIYNAMPLEGVQALVAFMHDFERHGDKA